MFEFNQPAEDHVSLQAWFEGFTREVAALDYGLARERFDPRVTTFSTLQDIVSGIDQYDQEQWRNVWPTASDFRWHTDSMQALVSSDRLMATVALTWSSIGYHENGTPFDRPGRATIVLIRDSTDSPWRGIHAHVSLKRGVPQRSYGRREPGKAS